MTTEVPTHVVFETEARNVEGIGVTVIVTLFNYEIYIRSALDSIFHQSYPNIDLIVIDDASLDSSRAVALEWLQQNSSRFSQARLLSHLNNQGLAQARNTAFANASNEYVFVLDADNEIYFDAIEKLLAACVSAGAEAAYSELERFGEDSGPYTGDFWNPAVFATGNCLDAMALIKKSAWLAAGGYSRMKHQGWEDFDLWCKFVELGFKGVFVPQILCRYRVHKTSMLRQMKEQNIDELKLEMKGRHPWLRLRSDFPKPRPEEAFVRPRYEAVPIQIGNTSRPLYFRPESTDIEVIKQVFAHKNYDLRSLQCFPRLAALAEAQQTSGLRPLIIDAGANIGASAVYFSIGFPKALVVAIEPERGNFELLVQNVSGLSVKPIRGAIASQSGLATVIDPGIGHWGYRTMTVGVAEPSANIVGQITVNQIYESYLSNHFSPFIVKIDIEGGEKDLFSRNTGWVDRTPLIIIELHDQNRLFAHGNNLSESFFNCVSKYERYLLQVGELTFCIANDLSIFQKSDQG